MSAFQFPDPTQETATENPITGNKYQWNETAGKWVLVSSTADGDYPTRDEMNAGDAANLMLIKNNTNAIDTMSHDVIESEGIMMGKIDENTKDIRAINADYTTTDEFNTLNDRVGANERALDGIKDPLTYQIGTDKVMRAGDPSIELVDSEGYYSNVKFKGRKGAAVTSDLQSIIVDTTELSDRIEALEEAITTLVSLIPPVDIGNATITSSADLEDGNAAAAQDDLFMMTCNNDGETKHGLRYHWSIARGNGRITGSTTEQVCTAWCSDPAPATVEFQCVISHPADHDQTAVASKLVLVADNA